MFWIVAPFPMARPHLALVDDEDESPPLSSTMQSLTVAPLMFWKIEIRPSWSEESLMFGNSLSPTRGLQLSKV